MKTTREAAILMDSAPAMHVGELGSPTAPLADVLVSLWQCNAAAILVGRSVNWAVVRPLSVSVLVGLGTGSP